MKVGNKINLFATILFSVLSLLFVVTSCVSDEEEDEDVSLVVLKSYIPGLWQDGTVYFRFDSINGGVTWDTSEDVKENEGNILSWQLLDKETFIIGYNDKDKELLRTTAIHIEKNKVNKLTATEFIFGSYSLTKVVE